MKYLKWCCVPIIFALLSLAFFYLKDREFLAFTYSLERDHSFNFKSKSDLEEFVVQINCGLYSLPQLELLKSDDGVFCIFFEDGSIVSYDQVSITRKKGDEILWSVPTINITHDMTYDSFREIIVYESYYHLEENRDGVYGHSYKIVGLDLKDGKQVFEKKLQNIQKEMPRILSLERPYQFLLDDNFFDGRKVQRNEGHHVVNFLNQIVVLNKQSKLIKKLAGAKKGDYLLTMGYYGIILFYDPDSDTFTGYYDIFKNRINGQEFISPAERRHFDFTIHTLVPGYNGNFYIFLNKLKRGNEELPKMYTSKIAEFDSTLEGEYLWIFPNRTEDEKWFSGKMGSVHPINSKYFLVSENSVGGRLSLVNRDEGIVWEKMFKENPHKKDEGLNGIYRAYLWSKEEMRPFLAKR